LVLTAREADNVGSSLREWIVEMAVVICPSCKTIVRGVDKSTGYRLMRHPVDYSSANTTRVLKRLLVLCCAASCKEVSDCQCGNEGCPSAALAPPTARTSHVGQGCPVSSGRIHKSSADHVCDLTSTPSAGQLTISSPFTSGHHAQMRRRRTWRWRHFPVIPIFRFKARGYWIK
jgi:hypothetical protein